MKKLKKLIIYSFSLLTFLFIIGFSIESIQQCPDDTLFFVSEQNKEYFSPPCIMKSGFNDVSEIKFFAVMTNLKVYKSKDITINHFTPNIGCRQKSGFLEQPKSYSLILLEKIGLVSTAQSRWNTDGSWNY